MDINKYFIKSDISDIREEVMVSDRFKDDDGNIINFSIRPISEYDNEKLRNKSRRAVRDEAGHIDYEIDYDKYLLNLVCSSVVSPDIKSAELQEAYGVIGEDNLIKKMLLAGEYANLLENVQRICGFFEPIRQEVNEIKN